MDVRRIQYPLRHPIPQNLSGMGQIDILTDTVTTGVQAGIKSGVEAAWPYIETKTRALLGEYEAKYTGVLKYGAPAVTVLAIALLLSAVASVYIIKDHVR